MIRGQTMTEEETKSMIQKLSKENEALEKQVTQLEAQLEELKKEHGRLKQLSQNNKAK